MADCGSCAHASVHEDYDPCATCLSDCRNGKGLTQYRLNAVIAVSALASKAAAIAKARGLSITEAAKLSECHDLLVAVLAAGTVGT